MSTSLELKIKAKSEFAGAFSQLQQQLDKTKRQADQLGNGTRDLSGKLGTLSDNVGRTATTLARSAEAFGLPAGALRALDDVMDVTELGFANLTKSAAGFNASSIAVAGAGLAIGTALGTALRNLTPLGAWLDKYAEKLSGLTEVERLARAESKAAYERLKAQQQEMLHGSGQDIAAKLKQAAAAEKLEKASKLMGFEIKNLTDAERVLAVAEASSEQGLKRAADAKRRAAEEARKLAQHVARTSYELQGQVQAVEDATRMLEQYLQTHVDLTGMLPITNKEIEDFNAALGQGPEIDPAVIGSQFAAAGRAAKQASENAKVWGSVKEGLKAALADLPNVILGAIQGGGNVGEAIGAHLGGSIGTSLSKSLTPILTKALGKTLGSALGSVLPGLGSILGAGIGKLVGGAIGKLFGSAAKEVRKLRDEFIASAGGAEALKLKANQAGVSLDAIWKAKNKDQLLRAIDQVKAKLATWDQANEKLNKAIEKYGIKVEELGPKFRQQKLDSQAASLLEEWELLRAAGVDVAVLVGKMGPAMTDYVNAAVRGGADIPKAMKPAIDALWEQGKLLHEDGTAFTEAEYKALKYGTTTTEAMMSAVDAILKLVEALTGIPQNVTTTHTVRRKYEGGGDGGEGPPGPPAPPDFARGGVVLPFVPRAARGIYTPARPGGMLVRMGEAGEPEVAMPVRNILAMAERIASRNGGGGGGGDVYLDGAKVGRQIERRTAGGYINPRRRIRR